MNAAARFAASIGVLLLAVSIAQAATVNGTVKGPDGAPFEGAFVLAQNSSTRITVSVLSDRQGHYEVPNLPAGEYTLRIKAVGYKADPQSGVKLSADQAASADFVLQKGMVRWSDLSRYQGERLLPDGKGKDVLESRCFICHDFQSKMASVTRDADGWRDRVDFMRSSMKFTLGGRFSDDDENIVVQYLTAAFGPDATIPKSPADLPAYQGLKHAPFSDDAMKIVYVEYDMPTRNKMPFSAAPDKNGIVWIPEFGDNNKLARLDPKTAHIDEYPVPNQGTAAIHSAYPAPDGMVWMAEQGSNKLAKFDPATKEVTEYQDSYLPGKEGMASGGAKHTVRADTYGVWATGGPGGGPLVRFDTGTRKFTHIPDTDGGYGLVLDKDGNCWYAEFKENGELGKIDGKTLKVSKWAVPTPDGRPRRLTLAPDGSVWFAEFTGGKIGHFDPKTETMKEWSLPGQHPTPYAFGMDGHGDLWYASADTDVVGRLDPKTGQVTEYPFTHAEITMREFFQDPQGRLWFGSAANDKVGYFYLASSTEHASK